MLRLFDRVGEFVDIEASSRCVDDVLVHPTLLVEFVGVARLLHPTVAQGIDGVAVDDLRYVVTDDDDGAVALDGVDAGFDLFCCHGIETGCRLVEEDDGGILEEHAGYGYALLLSAGEGGGLRTESVGESHDLVVDEGFLCRLDDFLVGGCGLAVADVLLDGAFEDVVFLKHQSDVLAQELGVVVLQVYSVEGYGAAIGSVEFVEQIDDGGFAGSRQSDEGGDATAADLHVDVVEGFHAVGIGEVNTTDFDVSPDAFGTVGAGRFPFAVGIEYVEEAFGVDEGVVEGVEDALQLGDGSCDVGKEHDVVHDFTDGHARVLDEHEIGGEDDDEHGAYLLHAALGSVEAEGGLAHEHLVVGELGLYVPLLAALDGLAVEGFDDVHALDDADDAAGFLFSEMAHVLSPAFEPTRLPDGDEDVDGYDEEGYESDVDVGGKHEDEGKEGTCEEGQEVDEDALHGGGEAAYALVDTGLEFAGLVAAPREEGHAPGHDLSGRARDRHESGGEDLQGIRGEAL